MAAHCDHILEGALVQHLKTESAREVLWMELLSHGADTTLLYWFLAGLAHLVLGNVEVVLLVRLTIVLKVFTPQECHIALL